MARLDQVILELAGFIDQKAEECRECDDVRAVRISRLVGALAVDAHNIRREAKLQADQGAG